MAYDVTVQLVRQALTDIFREVDGWFDRPAELRRFKPPSGGWSVDEVLEHITLTNHYLMIIIRRWTDKAVRRAREGQTIEERESDLDRVMIVGERGTFNWVRPVHMEPTGQPALTEVRATMCRQLAECLGFLDQLRHGEGSLCRIRMTVNDLGKIDLYQWLFFVAQHARRHLQQMAVNSAEFERQRELVS
jgi:DinB superfamily